VDVANVLSADESNARQSAAIANYVMRYWYLAPGAL